MQKQSNGIFDVTGEEVFQLLKPSSNPEGWPKTLLIFVGLILSPVTLLGCLIFFKRGHSRFMENEYPRLNNLPAIVKLGMIIGAVFIWVGLFFTSKVMIFIINWVGGDIVRYNSVYAWAFLLTNVLCTVLVFGWFGRWRGGIQKFLAESSRHGSARFAYLKELLPFRKIAKGFYIGMNTFYNKAGHLLTVAGTRAGKAVNLILQNLLMTHLHKKMSWVIIDPKGELAAISANTQRKAGRKVVILNPWQLLTLSNTSFNPLDILKNDVLNLADDVQMLAEALVPTIEGDENEHWSQKARTFISGLLLHLMTSTPVEDRHLGTIWLWLRLDKNEWLDLLSFMKTNDDPNVGDIVRATANEILGLMKTSDKEYGSVMSSAQKSTDFIKSPNLRDSMKSSVDFNPADLASGNVTIYVCIPFDKLKSHNAWTRLVVVSLMRSVVRNPKRDVCFLLDEAYAFGYHSEIDIALGAYAGFGIHVWSIFQTLVQIKKIYGDNWENFIANCSVRHFFNVSDNFSADYISSMFGQTSIPEYDDKGQLKGASPRALVTSDELRTKSGEIIYTVIDQLHPAEIPKLGYFQMNLPCDPNPYYKGDKDEDDESDPLEEENKARAEVLRQQIYNQVPPYQPNI